ncbi:hypothetical protein [Kibdelosporangium philippinense]|uniref:hypothetical protein n=1 Tax=Kibdelosporangium philippinense TaxID=211113 RepID=UPI0036129EA8
MTILLLRPGDVHLDLAPIHPYGWRARRIGSEKVQHVPSTATSSAANAQPAAMMRD